ncbi:MAG: response regulator [Betaproteobacteria bacterium]
MSEETQVLRLLVVDDHKLFRRGMVALLAQDERLQVVAEAGDAVEAIQATRASQPDVVLLDNHMPGVSGIQAIGDIKQAHPQTKIILLTVSEDPSDLAAGLKAGADGYLLKTVDTQELCDSLFRVWEGDSVISPEMMGKLVCLLRQSEPPKVVTMEPIVCSTVSLNDPVHSLSPREAEILKLIARGDSNKHIARKLDIAETTVKIHVQHILRKLNLGNRVHAAVYATERGWVD